MWHWVYKETMQKLDVLTKRVNECKDIQHASEFARWLNFSGLLKMFDDNPQLEPLPVDGAKIRKAVSDLILLCGDQWKRGAVGVIQVSELELLNRKMDLLAERVAQVAPAQVLADSPTPSLRVLV